MTEMMQGYLDGYEDDRTELPASLANRTHSYIHGWLNGRDDRLHKPRAPAYALREMARIAEEADAKAGTVLAFQGD